MATFERTCECCGQRFQAKNRTARYCSGACRMRVHRGAPAGPAAVTEPVTTPAVVVKPTGLVDQVRKTLERFGGEHTVPGVNAVLLATQMEAGDESGSALASMSKTLSALMEAAKAEALPQRKDSVDDVSERVLEKLGGLVS